MDSDPPTPVRTSHACPLENIIHPFLSLVRMQSPLHSLSCLPISAFSRSRVPPALLLPSLSLQYGQASRRSASAWPQHERAMTRRPERPSTRRRNGADGPGHGRASAAGPARVAPPSDLAPSPCRVGTASLQRRVATEPLLPVNFTTDEPPFFQAVRRCCVVPKAHVASVCFKCFRYFSGMMQMLNMDVAKVDRKFCTCCICCICCKCFR